MSKRAKSSFDFGLAACSVKEKCRTMMRTFQYAAPEIVLERGYSFECDVYSFAVVLWHICSLELNFVRKVKSKRDFIEWVVKRRGRPSLKAKPFPMNITRLIKECWHPNPQFRPQFKTIRFAIDSRR